MSYFSRRCLSVFAFGCFFVRLVVFCSHGLSLVIACAVWCSAEKSVPFIFTALFLLVLRCNAFYK